MMKHDIAQGVNVVRHKYSNDPNFKGKTLSKILQKMFTLKHSISTCPDKKYTKPLDKPIIEPKF